MSSYFKNYVIKHNVLWCICSKQTLWRQRNSRCLQMARTQAAEKRVTYPVMSRNNRRRVAIGVLCRSGPRSLLRNCAVNIYLQQ
jgi:hypothetical protein